MFGYACDETPMLMPAPIYYAHRLVEKQAELRAKKTIRLAAPRRARARSRSSTRATAWRACTRCVLSTQHDPDVDSDDDPARGDREGHQADLPRGLARRADDLPRQPDRALRRSAVPTATAA